MTLNECRSVNVLTNEAINKQAMMDHKQQFTGAGTRVQQLCQYLKLRHYCRY